MNNELKIKRCLKCGSVIKVIKDCNCKDCGIICCHEQMKVITTNSTEAAVEKHVPIYEIENDKLKVVVNHIMDEDHFIEWVCLKTKNKENYVYFKSNEEAITIFENVDDGILYSYCNKHGLWSTKIEK